MPRALMRSSSSTASGRRSARPATRACTPRPAPTTSSSGASASCCTATPTCPRSKVEEVAIAATTQIGDQGLTLGRTAALLSGLPNTTPGYSVDRMCAGAMTAVTNTASSIAFGAYDIAIAGGVEHMGRHPMGEGVDPNPRIVVREARRPRRPRHGQDRREPPRPLPAADQGALRRLRRRAARTSSPRPTPTARSSRDLVTVATRHAELGWGLATADEPPRPGTTRRGPRPR